MLTEKTRSFNVSAIEAYTENDVLTIALGNDKEQPSNFLIITRLDEENSIADECIGFQNEKSEYEKSGVISKIELTPEIIKIFISPEHSEHFGGGVFAGILNREKISSTQIQDLKESFIKLVKGSNISLTIE